MKKLFYNIYRFFFKLNYKDYATIESNKEYWEIVVFQEEKKVVLYYFQNKIDPEKSIEIPYDHFDDLIKLMKSIK